MGFQIFNFEDNSNVSVVSRKGIFKVIQLRQQNCGKFGR